MMKAVITFQGFTESDSAATGTEDLYFDIIRPFASRNVTTYQPRTWKTDVENLLSQLIRQRIHDVVIVGYSWGAGYTAQKFAKLAPEYGIRIPLMMLCDPVYRPTWMPAWMGANPLCFRSMMPASKRIVIPESVKRVCGVRQNVNLPQGHELAHESPVTKIEPFRVLPYSHTAIDAAPEWFSLVRNELEFLLHPDA